ncbi:MAG: hypothetical protein WBK91_02415 [Alphaproteobacteria bacterium]
MSNNSEKSTDLSSTIRELGAHHVTAWHQFTRAITYVGIATAAVLIGMWLFLYYI